jgi:hypothetical protein
MNERVWFYQREVYRTCVLLNAPMLLFPKKEMVDYIRDPAYNSEQVVY